eukprot:6827815-Alexandrium_andersonii.AAC.1
MPAVVSLCEVLQDISSAVPTNFRPHRATLSKVSLLASRGLTVPYNITEKGEKLERLSTLLGIQPS